jgi:hypothetical protein
MVIPPVFSLYATNIYPPKTPVNAGGNAFFAVEKQREIWYSYNNVYPSVFSEKRDPKRRTCP